MKLKVEREGLVKALRDVGHAVSERSYLAILHCVLLEAEGDRLTLAASNLESGVRVSVEVGVEVPGLVAVAYRPLADWVAEMEGDTVKMELMEKVTLSGEGPEPEEVRQPMALTCRCGRYKATIKEVFGSEDFPVWPQAGEPIVAVDVHDVGPAVEAVVWAALKDDPVLEGVLWDFSTGVVTLMATNRDSASEYKLAVRPLRGYEPTKAVLYPKAMGVLAQVADSEVAVAIGANHAVFTFEGGQVYSGTTNVNYPHLDATIDEVMRGDTVWEVPRSTLHHLVRMARIFARQRASWGLPYVKFAWSPGDPSSVAAEAVSETCDFQGQIGASPQEGQLAEFHAGADLLESALGSMTGDTIRFHFQDDKSGIGMEPIGGCQRVAFMPVTVTGGS